jgi:hypothetical protein
MGAAGVLVCAGWSLAARSLLLAALDHREEEVVQDAVGLYQFHARELEERIKVECRLMGDDPRLRSAIATPGIDESTIRDLLGELRTRARADVLAVLTPAGKVLTVVGQESLYGLDLSTSRFVRGAREEKDAITGTWVIEGRLLHVGVLAIRFGDRLIAYFLNARPLDENAVGSVYSTTGTGMSLLVQGKPAITRPDQPEFREASERIAATTMKGIAQVEAGGKRFFAHAEQVEGALPAAHVVWLRPAREPAYEYEVLIYLFWVPVLITIAFVLLFAAPDFRQA